MADPYTDEAIEALERLLRPGDDWPSEAISRLLATIRARDAAHRQEIAERDARIAELERAANRNEWSGADDWQRMHAALDERDARIAELEADINAMEEFQEAVAQQAWSMWR